MKGKLVKWAVQIPILALMALSAAPAQQKPPQPAEVGSTVTVAVEETLIPAQPGIAEGEASHQSHFPSEPASYLPMPLPRSDMEGGGISVAESENLPVSMNLETGTETEGELQSLSTGQSPFPFTAGSRGEDSFFDAGNQQVMPRNFSALSFVGNPEDYPWRVAVKLFMNFRDTTGVVRGFVCSGSLIDPKHVITAGHCVYAHDDPENGWVFNDWAESIVVVPAYEDGVRPYGDANAVQLHSWTGWTVNEDFDHDIGIIDLDRPIAALTGWHGYGWNSSCGFFTGNNFRHAGYPAESPFDGQFMYTNFGNYDACESILGVWFGREVRFDSRSWGGQSGSGSYQPPGDCPSCWVWAVLSNGTDSATYDVRLDEGKFNNIGGFISQDTPSSLDLIPLDVQISPDVIDAGEQLGSMSYLVHNYSSAAWSGTVDVDVYLSTNNNISTADTLIQSHSFNWSFQAKSSVRVTLTTPPTIPASTSQGGRFIGVILDILDANTSNNDTDGQDAAPIQVNPAPPDLVVPSASVNDPTLTSGQSFTISATVLNQGNGASSSTTLRYFLSTNSVISPFDTLIATDGVPGLPSGGSSNESASITAPAPGGYWVGACVDTVSGESNTSNNCSAGVPISVTAPAPDLVVPAIGVSDSSLSAGQAFTINATVANQGIGNSASTTLRYFLSTNSIISTGDTLIGTDAVSALSPGGTSNESEAATAPGAGTFWVGACVDAVSGEASTANNCSEGVQITVIATAPDLVVSALSVNDATLTAGQAFTINATAHNQGNASSAATTLRYFRSTNSIISPADTPFGTDSVAALSAGASSPESAVSTAPAPGTYWVGACLDAVAGESSTANNCSSGVQITVSAPDVPSPQGETFLIGDFNLDGLDDLAGLTCDGRIFYTTNLSSWVQIPGRLSHLVVGDFDGNGRDDIAGLTGDGRIFTTTNLASWSQLPGLLSKLISGDFNNDGLDDLAGIAADGRIFYTTNMSTWTQIPGRLSQLTVGDLDLNGRDDLVGLTADGRIFYTTNFFNWVQVGGFLNQLITWDGGGLGTRHLAGLAADGRIFVTTNLTSWVQIPGRLDRLTHGDYNQDGVDDLGGLTADGRIFYTVNNVNWIQVSGRLDRLAAVPNRPGQRRGNLGGSLADDLAGLASDGRIFTTFDKSTWIQVPGRLCP